MNKKTVLIAVGAVTLFLVGTYAMTSNNSNTAPAQVDEGSTGEIAQVEKLTPDQLNTKLAQKDFVLIDVHTPEQVHVPKTDYLISHIDIDTIEQQLESKDTPVVLYCRSGNMSDIASHELAKRGYTNVFDLAGGMNAWLEQGLETTDKGSVNQI